MKYEWQQIGDSENPKKIAIIATSNGFICDEGRKAWIAKRVTNFTNLGFCVYIPQYEDGSLIFEPDAPTGSAQIGESHARAVSPTTGAQQIIDAAKNGWDIFPYMGGTSFVDKIGLVTKHFNNEAAEKPKNPIRMFCYSDCSYGAFLQSHHPDIFRFYSTTSAVELGHDEVAPGAVARAEYDSTYARKVADLSSLLSTDEIKPYPRKILYSPSAAPFDLEAVQYFPLHTDMLWATTIDFDVERGGGGDLGFLRFGHIPAEAKSETHLNTSRPYILGLEGFLQQPAVNKKYDNQFPKHLDEFLSKCVEKNQLPIAIEIGLLASRLDGSNGYNLKLHDEETGLILVSGFNIERLFRDRAKIANQIREIAESPAAETSDNILTAVPEDVMKKVIAGAELDKEDIAKILAGENEKILKMQGEMVAICEKYKVPAIMNNRCGHTLNMGVVGGGLVNYRSRGDVVVLEQVPSHIRVTPSGEAEMAKAHSSLIEITSDGRV